MRSGGINFNYFPENKLSKLANLVEFKRMLMFCLEDWGGWASWAPLSIPLHVCLSFCVSVCICMCLRACVLCMCLRLSECPCLFVSLCRHRVETRTVTVAGLGLTWASQTPRPAAALRTDLPTQRSRSSSMLCSSVCLYDVHYTQSNSWTCMMSLSALACMQ